MSFSSGATIHASYSPLSQTYFRIRATWYVARYKRPFNDEKSQLQIQLMELYRTHHGYRIWDVPNRLHVGRKEMFLFIDALNTFYLRLYGRKEGNVLLFYLTTHSTHFRERDVAQR